ncbi:MAG TPA: dehydrogenase, partial [Myxococcales bacterium]|nr:dehydrogenase [Myxococcales bacterium]
SSVTGQEVAAPLTSRFNLGDIDTGVVRDQGFSTATSDDSAFVVSNTGTVTAIDATTLVQRWAVNVGATSTFVTPTGGGFIASVKTGTVQRWLQSTVPAPTLLWSAAVPSPSGVRIDFVRQKIFAGGSDGNLYELDAVTGASRQFPVDVGQAVGTPTIDTVVNRLHVGSLDGRLCSFGLPFP